MGNKDSILVRIAIVHFFILVIVQVVLVCSENPSYMNKTLYYEGVVKQIGQDGRAVIAK